MDSKTIMLKYFTYDGRAGDGIHFWVGNGPQPAKKGVLVPDERGYLEPLGKYEQNRNGKRVTLQLPGNLTVFDINWFSIYDVTHSRSLGYVIIPGPDSINVPPALVDVIEDSRKTRYYESVSKKKDSVQRLFAQDMITALLYCTCRVNYVFLKNHGVDLFNPEFYAK